MRIILLKIILLLLICVNHVSAQKKNDIEYFPLTIAYIEIANIDSVYTQSQWITMSIPPSRSYRLEEYIFTMNLSIVVKGDAVWNDPFVLLYKLPDNESGYIVVNKERYNVIPDKFNYFFVEVHSKKKGWVKFELAILDELTDKIIIPETSYPLVRRDFLLK